MLTPEQKKQLAEMLVKRLATGEDLETATTFLVNFFRKRAHERRAKLTPKRAAKRHAKRRGKRRTMRDAQTAAKPRDPDGRPPKRGTEKQGTPKQRTPKPRDPATGRFLTQR